MEDLVGARNTELEESNSSELNVSTTWAHDDLDYWDFNMFEPDSNATLPVIGLEILRHHDLLNYFHIDEIKFKLWLHEISEGYFKSNPYHNSTHAADVLQATHCFVLNMKQELPPLALFALLISAIIHDFRHPGVNNHFLYRILDPLAIQFNGISILENMHIKDAFSSTLNNEPINWLCAFNKEQFIEFHSQVTQCILATDMSKHVELLSRFNARLAQGSLDLMKKNDLKLLLPMLLKLSDISNPFRPWDVAHRWSDLIVEEFFRQGEEERARHLAISPFMDRCNPQIAKSQTTFISWVVSPLLQSFQPVLNPEIMEQLNSCLRFNEKQWNLSRPPTPIP